jgi:hypothetical protein
VSKHHIDPAGFPVKWFVIPVKRMEKFPPLVKYVAASNDPAQIAAWKRDHPGCNFAVNPTKSNLIIVDVDTKPGKRGKLSYWELDLEYGFPPTFTVRSPSGGFHRYYRGQHIYSQSVLGPDIDTPNYAILPGSRTAVGMYRAINDLPVAPAPSWLYEILGKERPGAIDQIPVVEVNQAINVEAMREVAMSPLTPVSRMGANGEKTLFDFAARFKDAGISEWMTVQILAEDGGWNSRCDPPWSIGECAIEDDLAVKVHNAFAYATQNRPGCDTGEAIFGANEFDGEIPVPARKRQTAKDRASARKWKRHRKGQES